MTLKQLTIRIPCVPATHTERYALQSQTGLTGAAERDLSRVIPQRVTEPALVSRSSNAGAPASLGCGEAATARAGNGVTAALHWDGCSNSTHDDLVPQPRRTPLTRPEHSQMKR